MTILSTLNSFSELRDRFSYRKLFYVGSVGDRGASIIGGGQRVTLQHVEILRDAGVDAFVVTSEPYHKAFRTRLFREKLGPFLHIRQFRREIDPDRDLVVLPGRFAERMDDFPGNNKILFSQNIWVTINSMSLDTSKRPPFKNSTLRGIFVVSDGNAEIARLLQPDCPVIAVRNSVATPPSEPLSDRHRSIVYPPLNRAEKNPRDTRAVLKSLQARLAQIAHPNLIEAAGLSHSRLTELLSRASALLFLSTHEGLPLLPLEAMAGGAIVLAYDRSPMSEIIDHRCLFRFGDLEAIVDALESVLMQADEWRNVRMENYERIKAWSRERQAESVRDAWMSILMHMDKTRA